MARTSLPPGFRFHPTDVELIMYYLKRKVLAKKLHFEAIADVEIYKYAPWDLPDKSCLRTRDLKWYFYCAIEKKYASGLRMNRATDFGYWKSTGKDRAVRYNDDVVGMIKTLVFHRGKAPKGDRTDWVMYEYRLEDKKLAESGAVQDSYVLCVLFKKDGPGPNIGAQYGAPFKEEDWEDDDDDANAGEEHNGGENLACVGVSVPAFILPNNQNSPQAPYVPEGMHIGSSPLCPAEAIPSGYEPIPEASNVDAASAEPRPSTYEPISLIPTNDVASGEPSNAAYGDDIFAMLNMFSEGDEFTLNENYNESTGSINHGGIVLADPFEDGLNFYDLGNLGNFPASEHGDLGNFPAHEHGDLGYLPAHEHGDQDNFPGHEHGSNIPNYPMDRMDQGQFLELTDLEMPLHSAQVCVYDNVQTGGFYVNNYHNNSVNLFSPANPCPGSDPATGFSQLPILHGGQYGFDSPLNRFSKDDSVYGNHFHQ